MTFLKLFNIRCEAKFIYNFLAKKKVPLSKKEEKKANVSLNNMGLTHQKFSTVARSFKF